ncbi:MAG: YihY/virulence factor BrkB family protein [Acidimicrobiia bacterium]|nr:YihY/virulence factor BrkB family protein [Acidimicrobiia bacterium]
MGLGDYAAVARRIKDRAKAERLPLLAAGVAFFALFSLVPALAAVVAIYGMVADPDQVAAQVDEFAAGLPPETQDLLVTQIESVIEIGTTGLGFALLASLAVALWSASSGVRYMIDAVNVAYDEDDDKGLVKSRVQALVFTLGAAALAIVATLSLTVLPALARRALGDTGGVLVTWLRWPTLGALVLVALSVLYRSGPERESPKWRWATPGSAFAVVAWLLGSVGFSVYVNQFGGQFETYGQLGAVLVTMMWLLITCAVILLGAYVNAELEHQASHDTTGGAPEPQGRRGAVMADHEPVS